MKNFVIFLNHLRFFIHIIVFKHFCKSDKALEKDFSRWCLLVRPAQSRNVYTFVDILTFLPEFRNLFYYRIRKKNALLAKFLAFIAKPQPLLEIRVGDLGGGCFIQHGFATIVYAKSIGENLWVNQGVTIGFKNATDSPSIGNNVTINAGAKVIGDVHIGDNAIVGANAVVVKDVPANAVVGGVPAKVLKYRNT